MEEVIIKSLDLITNGVVISDPNQKDNPIVYVNKAFTEITGYNKEEVLGKNCRFLQGKDTSQDELNKLRKAIKNRKATNVVLKNYTKKGKEFWNELYISPIIYEGKEYFIGIQQEVTVRVNQQIQLNKYKKRLELLVEQRTKKLKEANQQLLEEIEENKKSQKKIILLNEKLMIYGKNLEKKILSKEQKLTKQEKILMEFLLKNPNSKIKDIQDKTGLAISTISTVKKRLLEKNLDEINVPSPNLFNIITLVVYRGEKIVDIPEEAFFSVIGKDRGFYFMANKDWQGFNKSHKVSGLKKAVVEHFDTDSGEVNFFGIQKTKEPKMYKSLPKTLYGLLKYKTTKLAAERTNLSLQTTTKNVKELKNSNILNTTYVNKISKSENIVLTRKESSFFSLKDDNKRFGVSLSKSWQIIDTEDLIIPLTEAKINIDFSGAIKKNYLLLE